METKTKELSDALQKIGEAMYKNQQADQAQGTEGAASDSKANGEAKTDDKKSDEEPVEGEVVN